MSQRTHKFFDADLLNEQQASETYRRAMNAIDMANKFKQTPGPIRVNHMHAQLSTLYDAKGRLVRFWLRTERDNRLVMIGNREGMLPMNLEPVCQAHH